MFERCFHTILEECIFDNLSLVSGCSLVFNIENFQKIRTSFLKFFFDFSPINPLFLVDLLKKKIKINSEFLNIYCVKT